MPQKDTFIYITFILLGCCLLSPFNAFVSVVDYWKFLEHPELISSVPAWYQRSNLSFMLLMVFISKKVPRNFTIVFGFFMYFICLCSIPILNILNISDSLEANLIVTSAFVAGIFNGILSALVFSLAISISSRMSQGVMVGNGYAGLVAGALRVITKFFMPTDFVKSAFLFFFTEGILSFLCVIFFLIMIKLPRFKQLTDSADSEDKLLVVEEQKPLQDSSLLTCLRTISRDGILVFLTFTITLMLFPGLTGKITSKEGPFVDDFTGWYEVLLSNMFMIGDFIGRSLPAYLPCKNVPLYVTLALSRVVFIPLFAFCALTPPIIGTWYLPFVIMFFFSATNGYTSTTAMMIGSDTADRSTSHTGVCGTLLTAFLNFGLFAGSSSNPLLMNIIGV
ncbi:hypothetical protein P9112_010624 [Eukaryota sp. TZLM1-RC]